MRWPSAAVISGPITCLDVATDHRAHSLTCRNVFQYLVVDPDRDHTAVVRGDDDADSAVDRRHRLVVRVGLVDVVAGIVDLALLREQPDELGARVRGELQRDLGVRRPRLRVGRLVGRLQIEDHVAAARSP